MIISCSNFFATVGKAFANSSPFLHIGDPLSPANKAHIIGRDINTLWLIINPFLDDPMSWMKTLCPCKFRAVLLQSLHRSRFYNLTRGMGVELVDFFAFGEQFLDGLLHFQPRVACSDLNFQFAVIRAGWMLEGLCFL